MSSSLLAGGTTKTTATRSLFALVLRAWSLCVLLVATAALLLVSPAAVVILLPAACMAASACLLCATAARILLPFFVPLADQQARDEPRSGVPELWKEDCVEVDRAEAPGGGFDDDDASSAEEGPRGERHEQERRLGFSSSDQESSSDDPCDEERRRRFYFVDTGSYYRTFYDLLAFWRSMEREATRGGVRNAQYIR
ncbi:hypothetical protein PAHAL_2G302100 [Panicum hallii]|uniref:Transmembrane protein n=1 Tax=Panicum hallii TaxID=206008 RepID=A0A2S3H0J5_9POAL|nr:hypothetical protein PAHAL_2G302100 [Panicum hallii]